MPDQLALTLSKEKPWKKLIPLVIRPSNQNITAPTTKSFQSDPRPTQKVRKTVSTICTWVLGSAWTRLRRGVGAFTVIVIGVVGAAAQ